MSVIWFSFYRRLASLCVQLTLQRLSYRLGDSSITDEQLLLRMRCLSSFVKTIMQTRIAISFGCLQMRRDFYLSGATGLSSNAIQQLRHAPAINAATLFPSDLLVSLNSVNYQLL